jgi:hypothetical protein
MFLFDFFVLRGIEEEDMREKRQTSLRPLAVMFWLLTFLALFLAPGQAVLADTNVGGTISGNTTWNTAGSPYIVTSNVFIQNNATLTIDPGVQVRFNPNTYLQVGHYNPGTLVADGTEGNEIRFTGDSEHPWYFIYFSKPEAFADTEVSGNLTGNNTWTVADSPYIVTG